MWQDLEILFMAVEPFAHSFVLGSIRRCFTRVQKGTDSTPMSFIVCKLSFGVRTLQLSSGHHNTFLLSNVVGGFLRSIEKPVQLELRRESARERCLCKAP